MPRPMPFRRLLVRKSVADLVDQGTRQSGLRRTLGPVSLTLLGLGAIIGTGIFVLTGVAAREHAGPAIVVSFVLAGIVSALAALAYAELASAIPVAGSAYTYAYAGIGEIVAWVIAWDLILEYAVGAMTVAVGWSGYVMGLVQDLTGWTLPSLVLHGPLEGGLVNLPAAAIVLAVTALLVVGIQESAQVTNFLVVVKVAVILFIITLGLTLVSPSNYHPFLHAQEGVRGIFVAGGLVFFAYIGFDALSTTAEETKNPQRNLPIGILASLGISTVLYVLASLVITGIVRYDTIDETEPFAAAFRAVAGGKYAWAGNVIAASAVAGITSVLIVLLLSQPRIFFSMARDGLLPRFLARVHGRFRTPYVATVITGVVVALVAGLTPIGILATVTNIGTLFAFGLVSASVVILRYSDPQAKRGYRVPGPPWLLPGFGALGAVGLMVFLPRLTWLVFLAWFGVGLVLYSVYGYRHSHTAHARYAERVLPWVERDRPVEDIDGIGPAYLAKLQELGIPTVQRLHAADASKVADRIDAATATVRRWQATAELMDVHGVGPEAAELLVAAGVGSIVQLASSDPDRLAASLAGVSEGRIPEGPSGIRSVRRWIESARTHPRALEVEPGAAAPSGGPAEA